MKASQLKLILRARQTLEGILSMDYPYAEHANNVIQRYELRRKTANEHGDKPCPNCDGIDRFYINERNGLLKHHCRQGCDDPLKRLCIRSAMTLSDLTPFSTKLVNQLFM